MEKFKKAFFTALSLSALVAGAQETATTPQTPWDGVLGLYKYDTHSKYWGDISNRLNGVTISNFEYDETTGNWYLDFTSTSDVYNYYLETTEDGKVTFTDADSNGNILTANLTQIYNPRYVLAPSNSAPGATQTYISDNYKNYIYTYRSNFMQGPIDPTVSGFDYTKVNYKTYMTKLIEGVNYRLTISDIDNDNKSARLTLTRESGWDNYVEGDINKTYIYFERPTDWPGEDVYILPSCIATGAFSYTDDSGKTVTTNEPTGKVYYVGGSNPSFLQMKKLVDNIYCISYINYGNYELTNLVFVNDKINVVNPENETNYFYQYKSPNFSRFNEALYTVDGIWHYGTTYVPTPVIASYDESTKKCTVTSAGELDHTLYYKLGTRSNSLVSRVPAQSDTDNNLADVDGWTSAEGNSFTFDLSTLNEDEAIYVKALSGTDNGAQSESIILANSNSDIQTSVTNIAADNSDTTPEYFNLQGIRLTNPVAGQIVIEKRGNSTRKLRL